MMDNLSDMLGEFIVAKFLNPCKKCLVKAVCKPPTIHCDGRTQYLDRMHEAGGVVRTLVLIILLIIECIVITATIGVELHEWFKSIL
jgi:hypothetical protein